jgi:hypothetical protein
VHGGDDIENGNDYLQGLFIYFYNLFIAFYCLQKLNWATSPTTSIGWLATYLQIDACQQQMNCDKENACMLNTYLFIIYLFIVLLQQHNQTLPWHDVVYNLKMSVYKWMTMTRI